MPDDDQDPTERVAELQAQLEAERSRAADLEATRRELAFARAGIDTTDSKVGKMLFETYKGDLSDVAALKAEATELGLLTDPTAPTGGDPNPDEPPVDTGTAERRALATGAPADTGLDEDPMERTLAEAREHMDRNGYSFEKAAGHLINQRANIAMAGDRRVLFVPQSADQRG